MRFKYQNIKTEDELSIYYKNSLFLSSSLRNSFHEYLRWLLFSFRVVYLGGSVKAEKKINICSSYNQKRALKNFNDFRCLWIFTSPVDGRAFKSTFSKFFLLLFSKRFLKILFQAGNKEQKYLMTVSYLFESLLEAFNASDDLDSFTEINVSNDHLFFMRALIVSCAMKGVKINYIQHACVGRHFPNLTHFDNAYLDGPLSKKMYKAQQENNITYIGEKRFNTNTKKKDAQIKKILFCLNSINEIKGFQKTFELVEREFPNTKIIVRLHRYINKKSFQKRFKHLSVHTIYEIPANDILSEASICIAGNSSVLIDAISNGCVPIYVYYFGIYDYYGLVENNIVSELKENDSISKKYFSFNFADSKKKYFGDSL